MKKFTFFLVIFFSWTLSALALDWDWKNEDCADIGDWVDQDDGSGASTQETFDGKSCFRFYVPAGDSNKACRAIVRGPSLGDGGSWTFEFGFYAHTVPTGLSFLSMHLRDNHDPGGENPYTYSLYIGKNYLFIMNNTDTIMLADINIEENTWYDVRWVSENRYVSVWVNGKLYLYKKFCGKQLTYYTNNSVHLVLYDRPEGATIFYLDYVRIDTSAEHLTGSSLQIGSEDIVIRYRQNTDDPEYPNGQEALRMYGPMRSGNQPEVLSIPLVDIGHECASKTRIYDGSNIKALMKLPEAGALMQLTKQGEQGGDKHEGKTNISNITHDANIRAYVPGRDTARDELPRESDR